MKLVTLNIDGMRCSMCESHVNDLIRKVDGTKKIKSSHLSNSSTFVIDDESKINDIIDSIEKDGYKVTDKKVEDYKEKGLFNIFKK